MNGPDCAGRGVPVESTAHLVVHLSQFRPRRSSGGAFYFPAPGKDAHHTITPGSRRRIPGQRPAVGDLAHALLAAPDGPGGLGIGQAAGQHVAVKVRARGKLE